MMRHAGQIERVSNPPAERPLMIFDGDCGFCRFWIARWRSSTEERVDYESYQEVGDRFPEMPRAAYENAVQLIETDGRIFSGELAVLRSLEYSGRKLRLLAWLRKIPGFGLVAHLAYRFIANHRPFFSSLTRLLFARKDL